VELDGDELAILVDLGRDQGALDYVAGTLITERELAVVAVFLYSLVLRRMAGTTTTP
jgi:hypothetical protein